MTLITLRPSGSSIDIGVAVTGGGTLNSVLADESDATYATWSDGDAASIPLADISWPAGAAFVASSLRLRCAADGGFGGAALLASVTPFAPGLHELLPLWSTPTTVTIPLTVPSPGTVGDGALDAAQLDLEHRLVHNVRVYAAYLDVVYASQPVIDEIPQAGDTITTTNRPPIQWVTTLDADGGPQTHYSVQVLDADGAVVASTGGYVAGSATLWTVPTPLPDGTYTARVQVAQTVNGALHESDVEEGEFTVDVVLPGLPALTVTPEPENGRVRINVGADIDPPSSDLIEIQRSSDDGQTWTQIRTDRTDRLAVPASTGGFPTGRNEVLDPRLRSEGWFAHNGSSVTPLTGNGFTDMPDTGDRGWRHHFAVSAVAGNRFSGYAPIDSTWWAYVPGPLLHLSIDAIPVVVTTPNLLLNVLVAFCDDSDALVSYGSAHVVLDDLPIAERTTVVFDPLAVPEEATQALMYVWINADYTTGAIAEVDVFTTNVRADANAFTEYADGDSPGWFWWDAPHESHSRGPLPASEDFFDHEAPHRTPIRYRARAAHHYSGQLAMGPWTEAAPVELDTGWWLKHPTLPALSVPVEPHAFPTVQRVARQGVHQPLGRRTPVIVSDTYGPLTGTVTLRVDTTEQRAALDELLDLRAPLLLTGPPGQGWDPAWVIVGDRVRNRFVDKAFIRETLEPLPFTVVDAPDEPLTSGFREPAA